MTSPIEQLTDPAGHGFDDARALDDAGALDDARALEPLSIRETTAQRRRMLGEFIRSRRARTTPEMVGMPPGLRRRTPGLRREEVALLSGIGITWYTWLEQGRSINVSAQVLQSVARVLHFDAAERAHLFALAELPDPELPAASPQVSDATLAILRRLEPFPAVVIGDGFEILAGNRPHLGLIGDYTALPRYQRNILWLCFVDPHWRTLLHDWDDSSRRLVAKFRSDMAGHVGEPGWAELVTMLEARSREFRTLWRQHEVAPMEVCVKRYRHAEVGDLTVEVSHLWLADQRGVRLTVYTPVDAASTRAVARLCEVTPRQLLTTDTETAAS